MRLWKIRYLFLSLALLTACDGMKKSSTNTVQSAPESSYCSGTSPVSGNATLITGNATYSRYDDGSSGLTTTSVNKIRYAEVQVLNSAGQIIQCGETDSNGDIGSTTDYSGGVHSSPGLNISRPTSSGSYTVKIISRANNAFVKASILNNPTNNTPYSVSITFSISAGATSATAPLSTAPHSGSLEGGAFNILDQIYVANNYLRSNTSCAFCTTFTVAPKAVVYWTAGLSPGAYYDSPSTAISFFNRTDSPGFPSALYILGGVSGSTCTDTDHFDKSVIIHEYGHFLESQYASTDSPGGSHSGNQIIDPRLTWSEGFANFFQAKVLNRDFYRDTIGNQLCGTTYLAFSDFRLDIQVAGQDIPTNAGEGTFREFATARALYSSTTSYGFQYIWSAFSDLTYGLKSASFHFRNPGLFFKQFYYAIVTRASLSATNYNTDMGTEMQGNNSQAYYGYPVTPQVGTCHTTDSNYTFTTGVPVQQSNSRYQNLSNRYFQYTYDGTSTDAVLYLHYTATTSTYGSVPYDLDLYVYKDGYVFQDSSSLAGVSDNYYPEPGSVEIVNLNGKPAGTYMIDIATYMSSSSAKDSTRFYIQTNSGKYLCP